MEGNPANHLRCIKLVSNGINYLSPGAGFLPSTVLVAPENRPSFKKKLFQPSIFRCDLLVSWRVPCWEQWNLSGLLCPKEMGVHYRIKHSIITMYL